MKKFVVIMCYVVGSLLLVYFLLNIGWSLQSTKKLNFYILDKTVTSYDRKEHKSFVWLLNNLRYVKPDGKKYKVDEDYYGFFPIDIKDDVYDYKSVRINEVDAFASVCDALYYNDCYGVYSFEWYKGKAKPIRSQKVFGGLNQNDFLLLKKMKENGKLIFGEYNMFSTPTNALVRSKTESLFNIEWIGWTGKYYSTFDTKQSDGPPSWMPNLFESQHKTPWPTEKSGIVLLNNDGLIEVLVNGEHLNSALPMIMASDEAMRKYGIPKQTGYNNWFEFVTPGANAVVPASFKIDVNAEGAKVFERIGLNSDFPAIVKESENSYMFYFAGDFSDNPTCLVTSKILGGSWVNKLIYSGKVTFFNDFYTPLITSILNEFYQYNEQKREKK